MPSSRRTGTFEDDRSDGLDNQLDVTLGPVPSHLTGGRWVHPGVEMTESEILVHLVHGARLLVRDGAAVTLDVPDVPQWSGDPSWPVQGWGMILASLQRGEFSLHATAVEINGHVLELAGHSGAGKSTTALATRQRGHTLLVDDLSLIDFTADGAWVHPFTRNVHLLPDAADALDLKFADLPLLAGGRTKAAYAPEAPPRNPRRIDAIVILEPTAEAAEVSVRELRGADRVRELVGHTSRAGLAPEILGPEAYFRALARLAGACRVYMLARPLDSWSMDGVLDALEQIAFGISQAVSAAAQPPVR